ncbi:2-amino-4-hydroxy-6-hydroxymethyldihydropteridine diphosphokinase [Phycisphaeraceae bacterium D3-23]
MATASLGLGSNLGDRPRNLDRAVERIASIDRVYLLAVAETIETPPMGPQDQGPYLNTAVTVATTLAPEALHAALQKIELDMGRAPQAERTHWGPRLIDIDLLLYDDAVINSEALTVPHPGLHERGFVLQPLAQIAPDARHPLLKKSVTELLASNEVADAEQAGVANG